MAYITPDQSGYPRITNTGSVSRANDITIFRLETPGESWDQPSERERAMTALHEYVEKIKPLSEF